MTVRVEVKAELLRWACDRSGLGIAAFTRRSGMIRFTLILPGKVVLVIYLNAGFNALDIELFADGGGAMKRTTLHLILALPLLAAAAGCRGHHYLNALPRTILYVLTATSSLVTARLAIH